MAINRSAIPESAGEVSRKLLKFKSGGPSVEEAKAAMLAAKEPAKTHRMGERVPSFIEQGRGQGGNTAVVQQVEPAREPATPEPVAAEPVVEAPVQPEPVVATESVPIAPPNTPAVVERIAGAPEDETQCETIDTKKFTGVQYKDGREWVAEITYKNGAGTERFTAPTLKALNLKLIEGKGHGTVKVRETVQRYKLGDVYDQWDAFYKEVKEGHGVTQEQFDALPVQSRKLIQDTIESTHILAFKENYPEYYKSQKNWESIGQYLNSRKIPLTLHNLELAYRDLSEEDLLETRPIPAKEVAAAPIVEAPTPTQVSIPVSSTAVATKTEDSALAAAAAPVPTVAPVTPAVPPTPRKRGATSLVPGQSSAVTSTPLPEDGKREGEPSEQELKDARDAATRGDMTSLKRLATASRKFGRTY